MILKECGVREPLCVQSLPQPWPRLQDFWLFTSINGCHAGWGYSYLFPICGWFEWPSSGVIGFYHYKLSWSCTVWLHNCLRLRSVCCQPNPCTRWNTWPPDDWYPWEVRVADVAPIGNSNHSSLLAVISMAQAVPNVCVSTKVFLKYQVNWNSLWCNTAYAQE